LTMAAAAASPPLYLVCFLFLFLSFPHLSLSTTDDVHDLLPKYGFPRGLIPNNVESYTLSPSGSFSIKLTNPCYIHFDRLVYYDTEIKGKLSFGAVTDVSGIQAKKLFLWVSVTGIEVSKDGDGSIEFFSGFLSEKLPAKQFEEIPVCKSRAGVDDLVQALMLYLLQVS
ncbi:hypothetical protein Tsubulata_014991, partial [Turnera subulata]